MAPPSSTLRRGQPISTATRIAELSLAAATALTLTARGGNHSEPEAPSLETQPLGQAALTEVDAERFLTPATYSYMVTFAEGTTCAI